jgi:hypothetical protein
MWVLAVPTCMGVVAVFGYNQARSNPRPARPSPTLPPPLAPFPPAAAPTSPPLPKALRPWLRPLSCTEPACCERRRQLSTAPTLSPTGPSSRNADSECHPTPAHAAGGPQELLELKREIKDGMYSSLSYVIANSILQVPNLGCAIMFSEAPAC